MNYETFLWRKYKHYLSTVISQRKEKSRMEKGKILFLELNDGRHKFNVVRSVSLTPKAQWT